MAGRQILTAEERMSMAQIIQQRVDELTFPQLTELTNKEKNKQLKQMEIQLKNYLINYEQTALKINKATSQLDLNNGKSKSLNLSHDTFASITSNG